MSRTVSNSLAFALLALMLAPAHAQENDPWAGDMKKFAEQDAAHPYPQGGVVLTGSSSARLWDVKAAFPQLDPPILNRGFGGSTYRDLVKHAELLILKHRPRLVILYSGDNDIAAGRSTESIFGEFKEVTSRVLDELPQTTIAVIPAKPSPSRWKMVDQYRELNAQIQQVCEQHQRMHYIDVWPPMLGADGKPRPELFRDDRLHMTPAGYELWNEAVRELVTGAPKADAEAAAQP